MNNLAGSAEKDPEGPSVAKRARREGAIAARLARLARAAARDGAPVIALLRADERVTALIAEAVAPATLTIPQFSVLMELVATPEGRLSLCEIGRRCLKSPPNVTAIVDRLEAADMVRRTRDDADRRVVLAEITDRGRQAVDFAAPRVYAAERRALDKLSGGNRKALTKLLDQVAR